MTRGVCVVALATLLASVPSQAVIVGGGGSSKSDCLVVFDAAVNFPPDKPKRFRCADGDACDADGTVNGVCAFQVRVCANSTYNAAACTLTGVATVTVDHARDNGDRKFDPDFQALQNRIDDQIVGPLDPPNFDPDTCTTPSTFLVPVLGPFAGNVCKRGKKYPKLTAFSAPVGGAPRKDRDKLKMECEPALAGCDPMAIYTGTFDRIQRQVFNRSCAVSGCHDSQTMQSDLLLEVGASHANLVDVTPQSPGAAAAGWTLVDAANASADTSFLYHKITGDLDGSQGARMPLGGPKLDEYLIDIIRLWIEAGAPSSGWVPGTF